ncbi:hypothetical protein a51_188 [Escherichia phage a51]|nr:hypothetical protein a51_188 [Escherichia phage a51]
MLNVNQTSAIVTAEENMNIKRMLFKQGAIYFKCYSKRRYN